MADQYYRTVGLMQPGAATGAVQGYSETPSTQGYSGFSAGSPKSTGAPASTTNGNPGTAQSAAGSPDQAGSGFVNLSQLLALNGQSGQQSANSFANQTRQQGTDAANALSGLQGKFQQDLKNNTVDASQYENQQNGGYGQNYTSSTPQGYFQSLANKANGPWNGPNSLQDEGNYQSVAAQLAKAQGRAQNMGSSSGVAAQVAQDTGLSPRQAAASAFYMGVTNQNIKNSGSQFTNLSNMLSKANDTSTSDALGAQSFNKASAQELQGDEAGVDNYWNQVNKNATANTQIGQQQAAALGVNPTSTPTWAQWSTMWPSQQAAWQKANPGVPPPTDPGSSGTGGANDPTGPHIKV